MPKSQRSGARGGKNKGKGRTPAKVRDKRAEREAGLESARLSTGPRIVGMLVKPAHTLEEVIRRPGAFGAALFFIAVNVMLTAALLDRIQEHAVWLVEHGPPPNLPPEELALYAEQAPMMASLYSLTGALVSPLITWFLVGLVLRLLGSGGGKPVPLPVLLNISVFAMTPHMLGLYLESLWKFFADPQRLDYLHLTISAAHLVPGAGETAAFVVLNAIKPFTIWGLVLASIGGAKLLNLPFARVAVPVLGLWFLLALVQALVPAGPGGF
jgi:hypothetical protein